MVLRIDMEDWEGGRGFVEYDNFRIASESQTFRLLSLGNFTGNSGQ